MLPGMQRKRTERIHFLILLPAAAVIGRIDMIAFMEQLGEISGALIPYHLGNRLNGELLVQKKLFGLDHPHPGKIF